MDADGYAYVGNVGSVGSVTDDYVDSTVGVRPVVSLISNTLVTGEGTTTNPYIVE